MTGLQKDFSDAASAEAKQASLLQLKEAVASYYSLSKREGADDLRIQSLLADHGFFPEKYKTSSRAENITFGEHEKPLGRYIEHAANLLASPLEAYVILALAEKYPDDEGQDILRLQMCLNALGFNAGPIDGVQDDQFHKALQDYRAEYAPFDPAVGHLQSEIESEITITKKDGFIQPDFSRYNQIFDRLYKEHLGEPLYGLSTLDAAQIQQLKNLIKEKISDKRLPALEFKGDLPPANTTPNKNFLLVSPEQNHNGYLQDRLANYQKWSAMKDALELAGAGIKAIDGSLPAGGVREVFSRDRFITIGNVAYLPDVDTYMNQPKLNNFSKYPNQDSYRNEITQAEAFLRAEGYNVVHVKGSWFEGGNIIRDPKTSTIFFGMEPWAEPSSAAELLKAINATQDKEWSAQLVPLKDYIDPQTKKIAFYHLDLAMSERLPGGEVLFYEAVTDDYTASRIKEIIGSDDIIPISRQSAASLSTNLVFNGSNVVLTKDQPDLEKLLTEKGYAVLSPLDFGAADFSLGGGGVHCMTNELDKSQPRSDLPGPGYTIPAGPSIGP